MLTILHNTVCEMLQDVTDDSEQTEARQPNLGKVVEESHLDLGQCRTGADPARLHGTKLGLHRGGGEPSAGNKCIRASNGGCERGCCDRGSLHRDRREVEENQCENCLGQVVRMFAV